MKIAILFFSFYALCCSAAHYSYAPSSVYSENDPRQITDEDILKAFKAKPQLFIPVRLAFYDLSTDKFSEKMLTLKNDKNVINIYLIPRTLIEGIPNSRAHYSYSAPHPIDIKNLRLFAARGQADLLILFANQLKVESSLNSWGLLYLTLLGGLLVPAHDLNLELTTEFFLFDVRNGYLYLQHSETLPKAEKKYVFASQFEKEVELLKEQLLERAAEMVRNKIVEFLKSGKKANPSEN
ncbi:MAG: hypothetical protein N2Z22_00635 [Turneriella sp.]|nr:hypothetical protein [Turneriella sp.]